ncbi:MAG: hypothetical protein Q9187_001231 [Circinaria calcarea]
MEAAYDIRNLNIPAEDAAVWAVSLSTSFTLRNMFVRYRDSGGISWVPNPVPELSAAMTPEQISCLNRFGNTIGHMEHEKIICFRIQITNSFHEMIEGITQSLTPALRSGRLWAIPNTVEYSLRKIGDERHWMCENVAVSLEESRILDLVNRGYGPPISASIVHSAMEADHYRTDVDYTKMFLYPHNAAASIGILGSSGDVQTIDMSPGEEPKVPDLSRREYRKDFKGFICAGHTSHSGEAGRIRKVAQDVSGRILCWNTVEELRALSSVMPDADSTSDMWTLFCVGWVSYISKSQLYVLLKMHQTLSLRADCPYSLHISEELRYVLISISSGTLLKLCTNGYYVDNVEYYYSSKIKGSIRPFLDFFGKDALRAGFSTLWSFWPYIENDKPPRPQFASVQTVQAACLPWCVGDAAVSPCHTFKPLVTTPRYADVMKDQGDGNASISSHIPGENALCLFLNMEDNYEDAFIVSKKYVENGGFSTLSMCRFNLPQSEKIPPVGSTMCARLYPWWKCPCQQWCTHKLEDLNASKYQIRNKPTGVVESVRHLKNGDISVKVRSYQCLQDSDKLSTPHGQKGVATIVQYQDMPIAHNDKHGTIVPDVVIAMSSIVTRQTHGQLYEACRAMSAVHTSESSPVVVTPGETCNVDDEFTVIEGTTGEPFKTLVYDKYGSVKKLEHAFVSIPYDTFVLDITNAIIRNASFKYDLVPEE